jgi:hypothetical protein
MTRMEAGPIVLSAFSGPRPDGMQCCHFNDDAWDNRPENLRWDTPAANYADRDRNGKTPKGETHGMAVLNLDAVACIRILAKHDVDPSTIARAFRLSRDAVKDILSGDSWTDSA